jgi:RND family efflux transporter MFP subunit
MNKILKMGFIFPLIIFLAIGLVAYKIKSKPPIEHQQLQFPTRVVEVIKLKKIPFRGRATAYGNVEPVLILTAKSEVSGKITYLHPALKKGASLPKDTLVLRIEPTIYQFSLEQSQAVLESSLSSLKQLQIEEKTTQSSYRIVKKNLYTEKKQLKRLRDVYKQKMISQSDVDIEEQKVLQLQQQLEDLKGKLAAYNSRTQATKAQIKQSQTQLAQSQDTLGRTEIRLPFNGRIGKVSVEKGEYISTGSVLFETSGTQAVEINAQLPVRQFYPLMMGLDNHSINIEDPDELQIAFAKMKLQANVSLVGHDPRFAHWKGKLLRISESIDPQRDTIGLVVAVSHPYKNIIPGKRPPLLKGMYALVEFYTPARNRLVIPRKAIHQGRVYIANDTNHLEIRAVKPLFRQGELVVIDSGLSEGEQLIINDVIPVMDGLPVKVIHALDYEKNLAKRALAKDDLQQGDNLGDKK